MLERDKLQMLPQLNALNLDYTKVTDVGLARLKGLARLQTLTLWHTQVTAAGSRRGFRKRCQR